MIDYVDSLIILQSVFAQSSFEVFGETYPVSDLVLSDIAKHCIYFLFGIYYGFAIIEAIKHNMDRRIAFTWWGNDALGITPLLIHELSKTVKMDFFLLPF